jgi:hypothetical protein
LSLTDEVRKDVAARIFEPVMLREARDTLDKLIEICRLLGAEPSPDIAELRARLDAALTERDSVLK